MADCARTPWLHSVNMFELEPSLFLIVNSPGSARETGVLDWMDWDARTATDIGNQLLHCADL